MFWKQRRKKRTVTPRVGTAKEDFQAELDARDRIIRVQQAELDAMAGVLARDRERIKAEGAAYARQRAEHEGATSGHEQRD
jgi:hypothetical protein